jgi:hypothetical protein
MEVFFENLKRNGLISRKGIDKQRIDRFPKSKLIDLSEELVEACPSIKNSKRNALVLRHFASLELGGGPEVCPALECRLKKIDQLARFAGIYSDVVFIRNFLGDYHHFRDASVSESELKRRFYIDLSVILHIRPLLEDGIVMMLPPVENYCLNCFASKFDLGSTFAGRFAKAIEKLGQEYLHNSTVKCTRIGSKYGLEFTGPEPYYEHGFAGRILDKLPAPIVSRPRLVRELEDTGEIALSKPVQRCLGDHQYFAYRIARNIYYEIVSSKLLSTSFLTHDVLHISFLQSLSRNAEIERRNSMAYKYLTTYVPFLEEVPIRKLLKLRRREQDSFIMFRNAISRAIKEIANTKSTFTENDARALYADVIAPKLALLDKRIQRAKKDLISKFVRTVISTVGAISFGLYTNFINTQTAAIVAALGIPKLADHIQELMGIGDAEQTVRNDDMYFIWKVKRLHS